MNIYYYIKLLQHPTQVTVADQYSSSQCCSSIPFKSMLQFNTVQVNVAVQYSSSHCCGSIQFTSLLQFNTVQVTVAVQYSSSHCCGSIQFKSLLFLYNWWSRSLQRSQHVFIHSQIKYWFMFHSSYINAHITIMQ